MSQSPLSPVGKRLRTMEGSDDDDGDENLINLEGTWSYQELMRWEKSNRRPSRLHLERGESTHKNSPSSNRNEPTTTSRILNNDRHGTSYGESGRPQGGSSNLDGYTIRERRKLLGSSSPSADAIQSDTSSDSDTNTDRCCRDQSCDSDADSFSTPESSDSSDSYSDVEGDEDADDESMDGVNIDGQSDHDDGDISVDIEYRPNGDDFLEVRRVRDADDNEDIDMSDDEDSDDEDEDDVSSMDYHGIMGQEDLYHEDDSFDVDSDEDEVNHYSPEEYLKHDPTPDSPYPKPDWITVNELRSRKFGLASSKYPTKRSNMYWFERYASNSLWMIQRLKLEKQLKSHTGSVNCLDFNTAGNLICSGSDDLSVCIWDWQHRRPDSQLKAKIATGHAANVFQSQFCQDDQKIVTSSRDGNVRLLDIESSQSELLLSSSGEIKRLAFTSPQTLVTCGTNASVHLIDLRDSAPKKLFTVRSPRNNRSCKLFSISSHPLDKHMIAVAGASPYVFLYDLRRITGHDISHCDVEPKPIYCMGQAENSNHIITSTAFNSTGDKLLISYNDDDLYVCRTDTCKVIHRYQGHRNKRTIKGCAWFGDNFVMSGSDDGHIYGWDLDSEHIVCFLDGDEGVVNCLNVHPNLPILASSGFEHDVKIWEPNSNIWPQTMKGIKPQICKNNLRRKRLHQRVLVRPPETGDDASDNDPYV